MGLNTDEKSLSEKDGHASGRQPTRFGVESKGPELTGGHGTPVQSPKRGASGGSKGVSDSVKQPRSPVVNLKPRPSRWADEEEDDQFIPIRSAFEPPAKPASPPAPRLTRLATPIAPREQTRQPDKSDRGYKTRVPVVVKATVEVPVVPAVSLEELSHMKESMVKKAEARKKEKAEEEARLEAERKERCLAKLKEIEDRQKKTAPVEKKVTLIGRRPQTPKEVTPRETVRKDLKEVTPKEVVRKDVTPREIVGKSVTPRETARVTPKEAVRKDLNVQSNREAYNAKRLEVGMRRGYELAESTTTALSAQAVEFVPQQRIMQPHYGYYPQVPPYWY